MGKEFYNIPVWGINGFANFLFWIFSEKEFDKNKHIARMDIKNEDSKKSLERIGVECFYDGSVLFDGNPDQDFKIFENDLQRIREQLKIPDDVKNEILSRIPDIEERVCIHVRRGDYVGNNDFVVLSKKYIETVYKKYYNGMKVVIISNDKEWCKENLSNMCDNVIISDFDDTVLDFYILVLSKAIICSGSSFSIFGSYLNKNEDCVVSKPYAYLEGLLEKIVPNWAKREEITDDMKV